MSFRHLARATRATWVCLRCSRTQRIHPGLRTKATSQTPLTSLSETNHPTAPKASINLKAIRENIELHTRNCENRNYQNLAPLPARIGALYDDWVAIQTSLRDMRGRHNSLSAELRSAPNTREEDSIEGPTKGDLIEEARKLKAGMVEIEEKEGAIAEEMKFLAAQLPNTTHPSVPLGKEPRVISYLNPHLAPPKGVELDAKSHTQIGTEMGLLDFSAAGQVSGWGWYYLLNDAVLLEQALVNYALNEARKKGWKLVSPPSMVYSTMAGACGFRPRDQHGEQQIYAIEQPEKQSNRPSHVMAGTAEIPLAGMMANRTLQEEDLPLKMVGVSRCYRAEAGARGAESKGLYRVHEFTKVELFAWTPPPGSPDEHNPVVSKVFDEMLALQSHILSSLKLHCRVLEMPAHDLGASAHRKIDIEAFMPSRANLASKGWGEVSSLSNCTDYQSRRLATKCKRGAQGKSQWAWTLNGTALAVPRVILALMENGYVQDRGGPGRIRIPTVLRPYMGGKEWIDGKDWTVRIQ